MCGRFQFSDDTLGAVSKIARIPRAVQEQLNFGMIYPSQKSLVLVERGKELYGTLMDFGFQSPSMKKRLINARAETALEKPMFASALQSRRCLIPCSLFYEWDADKQMISFYEADSPVLYMSGLYIQGCFIILTTQANASVKDFHHRMPLILPEKEACEWVLNDCDTEDLLKVHPALLNHSYVNLPNLQQQTLF